MDRIKELFWKIRLYITDPANRKEIIMVSAIGAAVIMIIILLAVSGSKDDDIPDKGKKAHTEQNTITKDVTVMTAHLNGHDYFVHDNGEKQYVYKDGKRSGQSHYSTIPAMNFNMESEGASDDITKQSDADRPEATGGKIFRGKQYQVENYLAYLIKHGYTADSWIISGGYADIYLKKDGKTYRFLMINRTDDIKVLIFDSYEGKIPDHLPAGGKT